MVPSPTGQFMDRRIVSAPLLALKSKIGAPPEIRSALSRSATAHRARRRPGTVDRAGALMSVPLEKPTGTHDLLACNAYFCVLVLAPQDARDCRGGPDDK